MLIAPQNLPEAVERVRERIARAMADAGRNVDSVTILAAGKGHPAEALRQAAAAGVAHFGENYLREALPKMRALPGLDLTWHFIGQLQANKTREIAECFAWVHGLDRLRIAQRLSEQRPAHLAPLNVCIQVNLAGEPSKGGTTPADLAELASAINALPRLKLRGLMCLPPVEERPELQRRWFAQLRRLMESLNSEGAQLDTLSMGMSGDLEAAVLEGATIVRIGTAIFGERPRDES
jgi:pyridoxal phosphate enzyme (YggS family)